jgi:hypothetical protein
MLRFVAPRHHACNLTGTGVLLYWNHWSVSSRRQQLLFIVHRLAND